MVGAVSTYTAAGGDCDLDGVPAGVANVLEIQIAANILEARKKHRTAVAQEQHNSFKVDSNLLPLESFLGIEGRTRHPDMNDLALLGLGVVPC